MQLAYRASQLVEGSKTAVVSCAQLVLRLELVGMNDDNSRLDGEMHNPSFNKFNLQSSHWISLEKKCCQGSWVSWPCLRVTWDYMGGAGRNINCEKMMPTPCSLLLKLDLHAPWHPTQYTRENHSWHSQTDLNHSCNRRAFSLFLQSRFTFAWHRTGKPGHLWLNPLPAHPYVRPDCMDRVAKDAKSNLQHKLRKARFKYFSFVLFACFCIKLEPMRQFQLNSWGFPRLGDPQNQPFFGIFHCKSSILEYPSFLAAGLPGSQCSKGTGLFRADLHAAPFIG